MARDGLQGERPVQPEQRVELIARLSAPASSDIEVAVVRERRRRSRRWPAPPRWSPATRELTASLDVTLWALVPNVKGAELATAAGVDHLTITISASPAYSEKNIHMTIEQAFEQVAAIRALRPTAVLDAVISCCFGSPFDGEDDHARRGRRPRRPRARPRCRPGDPRRHHRDGDAAPRHRGARRHGQRRRPAPPRHPRHGAAQRLDGDRARRRALRHGPRRPRRLAVRAHGRRQPRHRGPRHGPRRRRGRDRHRPRRACSTPGRCSPSSSGQRVVHELQCATRAARGGSNGLHGRER